MPMDRKLYPKDWKQIAHGIKEQANWCCQECGRRCKRPDENWVEFIAAGCVAGDVDLKLGRYVLTVAHLNHIPQDCSPENLKALCSGCHLRYDSSQMVTKRRLKRERLGQLTLKFEE